MLRTVGRKGHPKLTNAGAIPAVASPALEWLWRHLQDVRHPHALDCGPVNPASVNVLLRRGAKLYVADLISPARNKPAAFWDRSKKHPVFRVEKFLAQLPEIPPESLSAIYCWHLLDLLPRESLPTVAQRLCYFLHSGGVLFCLLHEPSLTSGADSMWWLENLTNLNRGGSGKEPYPYPALSNREVERLVPDTTVKTFLTRSGFREVLLMK
jgi:hypothetical protein